MADAAALRNLSVILLWGGCWIIATNAYYLAHGIARGLKEIWLIGGALASAATAVEKYIAEPLNELRKDAEGELVRGLSGLVDNLAIFIGLAALVALGVKAALTYMWKDSLPAYVVSLIEREIAKLHLPHLDVQAITKAVEAQVIGLITAPLATIRKDIARAESIATAAAKAAADAVYKAEHVVTEKIEQIVNNPTTYITSTVQQEVPGLAAAIAVAGGEVLELPGISYDDLRNLVNGQDLAKLGGLIAAIPLIRGLVQTLAQEAGLDSAECRAKNKAICGTDPLQWAGLLAGLAALGLSFDLADVVKLAAEGVGEAKTLLADAGNIPQDVIASVGGVIGQVAAGIAA